MPERRFIVFHVEMLFRKAHWSYWGIRAVAQITRVDPGVFDRVCGHVHLQTRCINKSFIAVSALKGLVLVVLTSVRLGGETIVHQNGNVLLGNKWQHSTHTSSLYEMKAKFFRPASWRVAWRTSHTRDGSTCTADRRCESWEMKTNTLKWMDTDGLGWWWPNPTTERKKKKQTLRQMRNPRLPTHLPVVLLKVTELSEALLAEGAGVGFHSGVDADMLGQVTRVGKWLGTMGTFVRLWLCVIPDDGKTVEGERERETGL